MIALLVIRHVQSVADGAARHEGRADCERTGACHRLFANVQAHLRALDTP